MSYNTTIANPVSVASLNPGSVVSDLEGALTRSIGQGLQAAQSTKSGGLQQEMKLLTDLLSQSDNTRSDPSSKGSSDPLASSTQPSTRDDPSTNSSSSTNSNGIGKTEQKLESALEQNITNQLQNNKTPTNGSSLEQEMNLLIQLLGQNA